MITIYGKPNCNFCDRAKSLLENRGVAYNYVDASPPDVVQLLHENYSPLISSVPAVIVDNVWIGGYEELNNYVNENYIIENNKVKEILKG